MNKKTRMLNFLNETIEFYSKDPVNLRATGDGGGCLYQTEDGRKCAIGRKLIRYEPEFEELSVYALVWNPRRISALSEDIRDLPSDFLKDIQRLHDMGKYWYPGGLTQEGIDFVKKIKKDHRLRLWNFFGRFVR